MYSSSRRRECGSVERRRRRETGREGSALRLARAHAARAPERSPVNVLTTKTIARRVEVPDLEIVWVGRVGAAGPAALARALDLAAPGTRDPKAQGTAAILELVFAHGRDMKARQYDGDAARADVASPCGLRAQISCGPRLCHHDRLLAAVACEHLGDGVMSSATRELQRRSVPAAAAGIAM